MKKAFKVIKKTAAIAAGIYALLFAVFYFDLDGKFIFHVVEPLLVKHYDKMERRDPLSAPYDLNKPHYEYDVNK